MSSLKRYWWIGLIVIIISLIGVSIWAGYQYGGDWVGFAKNSGKIPTDDRGKTLWDWLELLFVPIVLALTALLFNKQERKNELINSDQRNQENVLQNYFDKMNDLILEKHLMDVKRCRDEAVTEEDPNPTEEKMENILSLDMRAVRNMAQVRTVTVLRQLDTNRKNIVFQFLRDAELASFILSSASLIKIDLSKTEMFRINLCKANLSEANLEGANLEGANLEGANLIGINLIKANLIGANLNEADLHGAYLQQADLVEAKLFNANLIGANLEKANLRKADLTIANLRKANLLEANLNSTFLFGAVLSKANLNAADLSKASLIGSDLTMANLSGADLCKAKMTNITPLSVRKLTLGAVLVSQSIVNLTGAKLASANLKGALVPIDELLTAESLEGATMPDGKQYDPAIHKPENR